MDNYAAEELTALGFSSVGKNVVVAREVRFYAIEGFLGDNVRIDTYCILTGNIELHDNVHIAPLTFLSATGGKISMGAGAGTGPQVAMLTKSDDYTAADLEQAGKLSGDITVGAGTIIGAGCKLLPGITIGEEASIGSNCVITSDIRAGDMVVSRGAANITIGNRYD